MTIKPFLFSYGACRFLGRDYMYQVMMMMMMMIMMMMYQGGCAHLEEQSDVGEPCR